MLTGAFTVPKIRQSPAQNTIESTLSDADSEKAEPIREKESKDLPIMGSRMWKIGPSSAVPSGHLV